MELVPPQVSIRVFREAQGLTLAALAERIRDLGVAADPDYINNIELGRRGGTNEALMDAWARALSIPRHHIRTPADLARQFAPSVDPLVHNLREVAVMAHMSERYLTDGCRSNRWPHQRQGQRMGMTMDQIHALLAAHRVNAADTPADDDAAKLESARRATANRLNRHRPAA